MTAKDLTNSIIDETISGMFEQRKSEDSSTKKVAKEGIKVVVNEGQKLYSDLLPQHKLTSRDHAITILDASNIHESLVAFIPEVETTYIPPKEASEAILTAFETRDNVLISGNPGTGKSSLVKHLCALTGRPFIRINASGDMDSSHLFGQLVVEDGATVWKDGPVTEAVRHGAVLLWDEWDVTPPEIAMTVQWLLEEGGSLYLKEMPGTSLDKRIVPHDNFRIVCSGNTLGQGDDKAQFAGTTVQNTASLDRFGTVLKLDYLSPELEIDLICNKVPEIKPAEARKLVQIAGFLRNAYDNGEIAITMSPRTLLSCARKYVYWGNDIETALKVSFANKLNSTDYKTLRECVFKVYSINM